MKVYHVAWFSSCNCEIFLLQTNILPNKSQKMLRFVFGMWQTNKRKKKKKLFSRAQKLKSHIVMILIAYFGGGGLLLYLHIHKFFVERFAPPTMSALIRPSKINLFFFLLRCSWVVTEAMCFMWILYWLNRGKWKIDIKGYNR